MTNFNNIWGESQEHSLTTAENTRNVIENFLTNENDMMPLVKRVLANYLDSIVEQPEEFIKDYLLGRDKMVSELKEKIQKLENRISMLENKRKIGTLYRSSTYNNGDITNGLYTSSDKSILPF